MTSSITSTMNPAGTPDWARLSGIEILNGMLDAKIPPPSFVAATDIWPRSFEPGRAVFEGRPSARFYNAMGLVHGGWLSALLDTAMACAVHSTLAPGQTYATIELKTVFVRPVREHTGVIVCEGTLLHAGRRIAHASGQIRDADGELIAYGSETCLVTTPTANGVDPVNPKSTGELS